MSKAPKLRFKEFSGDWESKKLEDVTSYVDYRGKTPPKSESGIFLVTAKNIKQGYIDYSASQEFISEESYDEAMRRGLPQKGDVLLTTEAPLGNVAQIDREDIALAQRVIKFRGTEELDNTFLKYYFLSEEFQNKLFSKAIGTTVLGIQGKVLHKMLVSLPTIEEQEKIASFISLIDDKISLQGKKLEMLKDYKTGMMQKIFSRALRFKDDEGRDYPEWEEKKLGELIKIKSNRNKNSTVDLVLSVSNTKGFIKQSEQFEDRVVASSDISNYKIVEKNDFAFNPARINVGSIARLKLYDKGIISPMYICFKCLDLLDYGYLEYFLMTHSFDIQMKKKLEGSVRQTLSAEALGEIVIGLPCLDEQKKIGKFLNFINDKLEKEQEKLDSLNEYKKGLLQQMFV